MIVEGFGAGHGAAVAAESYCCAETGVIGAIAEIDADIAGSLAVIRDIA
ncbi:hypothetical protein [Methylomonas sp. DH-1]|nr:hypothetical protein [Methylomonas sp. DH-1]